jgi:hypothetical protein
MLHCDLAVILPEVIAIVNKNKAQMLPADKWKAGRFLK